MILSGFRQTNNPRAAEKYFRSQKDHKNRPRNFTPLLLDGHPQAFLALGDRMSNATNFCCTGVWGFHEAPSPAQLNRIGKNFKRAMFPGLAPERLAWLFYFHRDHGHSHVHFAVLGLDLQSNKRITPYADDVDRRRFELLNQLTNDTEGLLDPNDPSHWRDIAPPPFGSSQTYVAEHRALSRDVWLSLATGRVTNRLKLCAELARMGWWQRWEGRRSLGFARSESAQPVELRGVFARDDWDGQWGKQARAKRHIAYVAQKPQRIQQTAKELLDRYMKKASYNLNRYGGREDSMEFRMALESLANGRSGAEGIFGPATTVPVPVSSPKGPKALTEEHPGPSISLAPG